MFRLDLTQVAAHMNMLINRIIARCNDGMPIHDGKGSDNTSKRPSCLGHAGADFAAAFTPSKPRSKPARLPAGELERRLIELGFIEGATDRNPA